MRACSSLNCSAALQHILLILRSPSSSAGALFQGHSRSILPICISSRCKAKSVNSTSNLSTGKEIKHQWELQREIAMINLFGNNNLPTGRNLIYRNYQSIKWQKPVNSRWMTVAHIFYMQMHAAEVKYGNTLPVELFTVHLLRMMTFMAAVKRHMKTLWPKHPSPNFLWQKNIIVSYTANCCW